MLDRSGTYLYTIVIVEVNERKRMEELFQLMLESADATLIADWNGNIVFVNSQSETVFRYRHAELVGKTIGCLLTDTLHPDAGLPFGRLQIEFMKGKWDSHGRRRDGTLFPAEVRVREIETGTGTWMLYSVAQIIELSEAPERVLQIPA